MHMLPNESAVSAVEKVEILDTKVSVKKHLLEPAFLLKKHGFYILKRGDAAAADEKNKAFVWVGTLVSAAVGVAGFVALPSGTLAPVTGSHVPFFTIPILSLFSLLLLCVLSLIEAILGFFRARKVKDVAYYDLIRDIEIDLELAASSQQRQQRRWIFQLPLKINWE